MSRRGTASAVCLTLGLLALLASAAALYVRANVWERDGFAANAVQSLQSDGVRTYLGNALVDAILENASEDVIAAQPLVESAVQRAVASPAFSPLLRQAAEELHRTLFSSSPSNLVLDLADVGILLNALLATQRPDLATDIPDTIRSAIVAVGEDDAVVSGVESVERVHVLAYVLPPAAAILLALGLAFARDRRRALGATGLGLGVVALAFWVGAAVIKSSQVSGIDDPVVRSATEATLDAYLDDVDRWALILAGAGALLAAASFSALDARQLNGGARLVWQRATTAPTRWWGQALRGVVLVAAGAFLVLRFDVAIRAILAVAGFYLVLLGLAELIRLIERVSTRADREGTLPRVSRLGWALGGLALAGVIAAGVIALTRGGGPEAAVAAENVTACNGHAELCDRRLDDVVFAATHNSMAAAEDGFVNANHAVGIREQLDAGYRALLIDSWNAAPGTRGHLVTDLTDAARQQAVDEIGEAGVAAAQRLAGQPEALDRSQLRPYLCHVLCELGAIDMIEGLTDIREWLDEHPDEVLVVFIQDEGVTPEETEEVFAASGLSDYVYTHVEGQPFPTLRQMIDSGQRVLVMAENDGAPGTWYEDGFALTQDTPYDFANAAEMQTDASCELNRGSAQSPLLLLNHWVANYPPRASDARTVNAYDFLLERARRCERLRGHLPNLIAIDFSDRGDTLRVVDTLNGVA